MFSSDGTDNFVKRLDRRDDLARLIVLDTWIRNCDRCHRAFDGVIDYNRDNLLFESLGNQAYRLAPIDHSHCIIDVGFEDAELQDATRIRDENVYGFFPEFAPYIEPDSVAVAVQAMLSVDRPALTEIVNSVPEEWELGERERVSLVDFLEKRAQFLADTLPMKLVDRPLLRNFTP